MSEVALQYGLEASKLSIGECSTHYVCPICGGGSSNERTFVLRRMAHDVVFFRCYRDSCGTRGCFSLSSGSLVSGEKTEQPKREVIFKAGPFELLTEEQIQIVNNKCGTTSLQLLSVGVRIDEYTKRVMFPLYDIEHEQKGWCLRYYDGVSEGESKPKAKTVWFDETHRVALTTRKRITTKYRKCIVIVEDWPSANRVAASGIPAGAILGTGLGLDVLQPLVTSGYDNVVLCLDADAKATALRHKLKYGSLFSNFSLYLLSNKDIKDMNKEEYKIFISDIYNILDI